MQIRSQCKSNIAAQASASSATAATTATTATNGKLKAHTTRPANHSSLRKLKQHAQMIYAIRCLLLNIPLCCRLALSIVPAAWRSLALLPLAGLGTACGLSWTCRRETLPKDLSLHCDPGTRCEDLMSLRNGSYWVWTNVYEGSTFCLTPQVPQGQCFARGDSQPSDLRAIPDLEARRCPPLKVH